MTLRKTALLRQRRSSWRRSFRCTTALTALIYSACVISEIPALAGARTAAAPSAAAARSSARRVSAPPGSTRAPRRGGSSAFVPSPLWSRSSSAGRVVAKIRGGSSEEGEEEDEEEYDDEDESSDDENDGEGDDDGEEDENDDAEVEVEEDDSEEEQYDSDEEQYDSDEEQYDSDEEEEEEAVAQSSLKSSVLAKSQDASESESEGEVAEYDDLLAPPAMQQFAVSIGVMMLSNRIDILNAKAVRVARFAFVAYVVTVQLFVLYVGFRAKRVDDRTEVTLSNPLASLVPSGVGGDGPGGNFMVKALADQVLSTRTTAVEYDLKQAKKMNGGLLFPMAFLYVLHFRMKQVQPLLMQTATGFLNLAYSPLFQVYVLGRNLERPFKPPANAMMEAVQKGQEGGEGVGGVGKEEGNDAVSDKNGEDASADEEEDEIIEVDDDSEEEEEESEDESEYDSDDSDEE